MSYAADRIAKALCRQAVRRPWLILAGGSLLMLVAAFQARDLRLDTRLDRLLPEHNRAARANREIRPRVGASRAFSMLFEGGDTNVLASAVEWTAREARRLPTVRRVDYRMPRVFLERYRYLLLSSEQLDLLLEWLLRLQSRVSPMTADLLAGPTAPAARAADATDELEEAARYYARLGDYYRSPDETLFGLRVRPKSGLMDLGATEDLYNELTALAAQASRTFGIRADVAGNLRGQLEDYHVIRADLRRSGLISGAAILVALALAFRSVRAIPILVFPLAAGLAWGFGVVARTVGSLNLVTSFLLLALFGMGIDYSIHLVRRFQAERRSRSLEDALYETLRSCGLAVLVSAATTALAFSVLCISEFRGFREFGFIVSLAIVAVSLAMGLLMPACLVVDDRLHLVPVAPPVGLVPVVAPKPRRAWLMLGLGAVALVAALHVPVFDYDFTLVSEAPAAYREARRRHRQVFPSAGNPAVVYLAEDLATLDSALGVLDRGRAVSGSLIGKSRSIREIVPVPEEFERRRALVAEIRATARGRWTRHIDDPEKRRWVRDMAQWVPAASAPPSFEELPPAWREGLLSLDTPPACILGVSPNVSRKYGKNAMAFTQELYGLPMPDTAIGPVGETSIMAEILWCVTREGPMLTLLTLVGMAAILLVVRRSVRGAAWCLLPLISGLVLTFGIAAVVGPRLNFFNMVALPALIGLGADHGVHVYFRWLELERDTPRVQAELWRPLGLCTLTTLLGYSGMAAAHHSGLRSIGLLACLGLTCIWVTSVILLPGLLELARKRVGRNDTPSP